MICSCDSFLWQSILPKIYFRRNDFLQLLLDAASSGTEESAVLSDDRVLVAQALLFMIAGYETSSSALSSTAYELARHPEIQEKVRQETAELGHDSPYLEMVILGKSHKLFYVGKSFFFLQFTSLLLQST